ncbi:hypothetical protein OIU78_021415 [Salix suchowensis]|nr:hypothetical protein OIU78_021415 [Salix suchowensis]
MRQNTSLLDCCLLGDSGSLLRTCKNKRIGGE